MSFLSDMVGLDRGGLGRLVWGGLGRVEAGTAESG